VAQAHNQSENSAAKPVLVIEQLRELLAELREADCKPANSPILRGVKGGPLDLNMLAKRVIRPALRNPKNYRDLEAKPLEWQGFYSLRRGIATQLTAITRDLLVAKGLLRHSGLNTTLLHYIVAAFRTQYNSSALHKGRAGSHSERNGTH